MVYGVFQSHKQQNHRHGLKHVSPALLPIIDSRSISRQGQCSSIYIHSYFHSFLSSKRKQKSLSRIMKLLRLLFLLLLTTPFYFFSHNISSTSSSPSMFFLTGRRSMREQRMSSVNSRDGHENTKVLDEKTEETTIKEDSRELVYPNSNDNLDDLVYHVDYHGVTTHPTPTPKHPSP